MDAIHVWSHSGSKDPGTFNYYCELCALDGLRGFLLDTSRTDTLSFTRLNVGGSEDTHVCVGCGRQFNVGSKDIEEALRRSGRRKES